METLESKVPVLQSKICNFTENKLYYETSRCGIEDMKWFSIKNNLIIFYFFRRINDLFELVLVKYQSIFKILIMKL